MDNSRVEEVLNAVAPAVAAALGREEVRIYELPVAASAPEYFAEKAVSIAFWAVDLGVFVHVGDQPNVIASTEVTNLLTRDVEGLLGGKLYVDPNPATTVQKMLAVIDAKRSALGI